MSTELQGVALIEHVIDKVRMDGFRSREIGDIRDPVPVPADVLAALRFPGGQRPSPSLRRWLAFDASWLANAGWFEDPLQPAFKPRKIGAFAGDEHGPEYEGCFKPFERRLPGELYLLPLGSESRRALYVGEPDGTGEHPVIVTDVDDVPYVALMYPGFDVYMADLAGVLELPGRTYESLHGDARYAPRMAEHAQNNFGGAHSFEYEGVDPDEPICIPEEPPPWKEGDPIPPGARVGRNPFTGKMMMFPKGPQPFGAPRRKKR
jgi:hypothetical protein